MEGMDCFLRQYYEKCKCSQDAVESNNDVAKRMYLEMSDELDRIFPEGQGQEDSSTVFARLAPPGLF